jgi:alpha-tubulin suppressor-like RCC1 family protein
MNGAAYCWGSNSVNSGLLGDGNTNSTSTPVAVVGLPGTVTAVGAGATFSCALSSDSVYCWGSNSNSQLGQLATVLDKSYSPILVPGLTNVAMMSVNDYGGCVAKKNFEFWCWGQGAGASGAPKLMKTFSKMPSSIGHTGMGGAGNSYAVVDGLIYAFGNYTSQIGNPNAHSSIYNLTCLEEI